MILRFRRYYRERKILEFHHYIVAPKIYLNAHRAFRLVVQSSFIFASNNCFLAKINHVINFSQSQLLLAKRNEDRTIS